MGGSITIDISEKDEMVYEFTGFEILTYQDNTDW